MKKVIRILVIVAFLFTFMFIDLHQGISGSATLRSVNFAPGDTAKNYIAVEQRDGNYYLVNNHSKMSIHVYYLEIIYKSGDQQRQLAHEITLDPKEKKKVSSKNKVEVSDAKFVGKM